MSKPSYDEIVNAFSEYLACTNNAGDPVAPDEDDIVRAAAILERTRVKTGYYDWSAR